MTLLKAHALISGQVQGVWFREATRKRAEELGLVGWVRNLPDGRVEAHFEGPDRAVYEALTFVEEGPPRAHVTDVDVDEQVLDAIELTSFEVR